MNRLVSSRLARHLLPVLLAALALAAPAAHAQKPQPLVPREVAPPPGGLAQSDVQTIQQVETYLDGIKTLKARFLQQSGSSLLRGTFLLSRPGRLRFDYDPPSRDFIVADGSYITFWDDQMQEDSRQSIGNSLADLLLRKKIQLSGEVTVKNIGRVNEFLAVQLIDTAEPDEGSITLYFRQNPLQLAKWSVVDGEGRGTDVVLQDVQTGIGLDRDLFYFRKPDSADRRK